MIAVEKRLGLLDIQCNPEVRVHKLCVFLQDIVYKTTNGFTALPSNFELSVTLNSFTRLLRFRWRK